MIDLAIGQSFRPQEYVRKTAVCEWQSFQNHELPGDRYGF